VFCTVRTNKQYEKIKNHIAVYVSEVPGPCRKISGDLLPPNPTANRGGSAATRGGKGLFVNIIYVRASPRRAERVPGSAINPDRGH